MTFKTKFYPKDSSGSGKKFDRSIANICPRKRLFVQDIACFYCEGSWRNIIAFASAVVPVKLVLAVGRASANAVISVLDSWVPPKKKQQRKRNTCLPGGLQD
jgi:hypothetical protein